MSRMTKVLFVVMLFLSGILVGLVLFEARLNSVFSGGSFAAPGDMIIPENPVIDAGWTAPVIPPGCYATGCGRYPNGQPFCHYQCPRPRPHYYGDGVPSRSGPNPDAFIGFLIVAAGIAGVVFCIVKIIEAGSAPSTTYDIANIQRRTSEAHNIRSNLEADVAAARQYIESERSRARRLGHDEG